MKKNIRIDGLKFWVGRISLSVMLLFSAGQSFAQQDPLYTQYMENLLILNPAYAGSKDVMSLAVITRDQWVSMPGAPKTRAFAIHSPVKDADVGLGLSVLSDQVGPVKQLGVYADYSYTLKFRNRKELAFGLKGGVNFYEAGLSDLATNDPNDPVFANDINRSFLPNIGVGAFFHARNYYLGLSAPKLIENTINDNGVSVQNISREQVHFLFMAGYVLNLSGIIKLKPSVLARYVKNSPVSADLNATLVFDDRLWLGAMCRLGDSFGGLFQVQLTRQLKIGYSYDLPVSRLGAFNNGTHEFMLNFDFDFGSKKARPKRYF
ncbi:MAG: type IX secretion system membrane protein PorP/SprF [Prolixibacteraceae bacterium]|nr:type IX secretion system membrane protein PorP/SprF [Prolixibacteraceae bacterium]